MAVISVNIPDDVARRLQTKWQDLPRLALESLALEAYRNDMLTTAQLQDILGYETRYELDGFLKNHGVYLEYSLQELDEEAEVSRRLWRQRQRELNSDEPDQQRRTG